ncbi:hypothetical protein BLOT_003024 [Blomia tropicalis]|nr:hypothetical protein BLOT_003024 [Blomia tropicalis]
MDIIGIRANCHSVIDNCNNMKLYATILILNTKVESITSDRSVTVFKSDGPIFKLNSCVCLSVCQLKPLVKQANDGSIQLNYLLLIGINQKPKRLPNANIQFSILYLAIAIKFRRV